MSIHSDTDSPGSDLDPLKSDEIQYKPNLTVISKKTNQSTKKTKKTISHRRKETLIIKAKVVLHICKILFLIMQIIRSLKTWKQHRSPRQEWTENYWETTHIFLNILET